MIMPQKSLATLAVIGVVALAAGCTDNPGGSGLATRSISATTRARTVSALRGTSTLKKASLAVRNVRNNKPPVVPRNSKANFKIKTLFAIAQTSSCGQSGVNGSGGSGSGTSTSGCGEQDTSTTSNCDSGQSSTNGQCTDETITDSSGRKEEFKETPPTTTSNPDGTQTTSTDFSVDQDMNGNTGDDKVSETTNAQGQVTGGEIDDTPSGDTTADKINFTDDPNSPNTESLKISEANGDAETCTQTDNPDGSSTDTGTITQSDGTTGTESGTFNADGSGSTTIQLGDLTLSLTIAADGSASGSASDGGGQVGTVTIDAKGNGVLTLADGTTSNFNFNNVK